MLDTQTCNRINFLDLRDILEDLDISITRFEMECVFEFLQNDRKFGTIDFDEFLFCVAAIDDIRQVCTKSIGYITSIQSYSHNPKSFRPVNLICLLEDA